MENQLLIAPSSLFCNYQLDFMKYDIRFLYYSLSHLQRKELSTTQALMPESGQMRHFLYQHMQ